LAGRHHERAFRFDFNFISARVFISSLLCANNSSVVIR
jgi:hypothetical protein